MKFSLGPAPARSQASVRIDDHYQTTNWHAGWVQIISAAFSLLLYLLGFAIWPEKPDVAAIIANVPLYVFGFLAVIVTVLFVHEFLHLAASTGGLGAADSVIGLDWRKCMFYAYSSAAMSWGRSVWNLLAPLIVLTVIPLILEFILAWRSGWLGLVAISNASFAANDILLAGYILFFIPRSATDVQPEMMGIRFLDAPT